MLPPVLEIHVVWHPRDTEGEAVALEMLDHFHGTAYSGLIGGAVEVYVRSEGWRTAGGAPRPLPCIEPMPAGLQTPAITAVVVVLGLELASAVEDEAGEWYQYISDLVDARVRAPASVGVFPIMLHPSALDGTRLGQLVGGIQCIGAPGVQPPSEIRCRDLAQGVAQLAAQPFDGRLTVFVSHTKRASAIESDSVEALIQQVRSAIAGTRLAEFFDASDLQPNQDWAQELISKASTSALLAVRTDLYSSRQWCQREMLVAKRAGMPVVVLDALADGDDRGSFIMDHVPMIPGRRVGLEWNDADIHRALNHLVDGCLMRSLWRKQRSIAADDLAISWWADSAPEPVTFINWLAERRATADLPEEGVITILHPDPPLGPDELEVIQQTADMVGLAGRVEVLTPRGLAARGG